MSRGQTLKKNTQDKKTQNKSPKKLKKTENPEIVLRKCFPSRDEVLDVKRIACFAQYWICLENIYIYIPI